MDSFTVSTVEIVRVPLATHERFRLREKITFTHLLLFILNNDSKVCREQARVFSLFFSQIQIKSRCFILYVPPPHFLSSFRALSLPLRVVTRPRYISGVHSLVDLCFKSSLGCHGHITVITTQPDKSSCF